jgi:hypothetical protein
MLNNPIVGLTDSLECLWNTLQMVVHNFLLINSRGGIDNPNPSNQKVEEKMNIISWGGCSQIIGK